MLRFDVIFTNMAVPVIDNGLVHFFYRFKRPIFNSNNSIIIANTMETEIKLKDLVGETANPTKCKIITMWPNSTCKYADENGMCTRTIDDDVISDILIIHS